MKKLLTLINFVCVFVFCSAQTYPLRTFTNLPENAYLKDTNDELKDYEGTWSTTWDNKTFYITFKKMINVYNGNLKEYKDILVGKFKVIDNNTNNVLIDNTNIPDDKSKIYGGKFRKKDDKYSMIYIDRDLCGILGNITINFTDNSKTKLDWWGAVSYEPVDKDNCFFGRKSFSEWPTPFPNKAILTKQ